MRYEIMFQMKDFVFVTTSVKDKYNQTICSLYSNKRSFLEISFFSKSAQAFLKMFVKSEFFFSFRSQNLVKDPHRFLWKNDKYFHKVCELEVGRTHMVFISSSDDCLCWNVLIGNIFICHLHHKFPFKQGQEFLWIEESSYPISRHLFPTLKIKNKNIHKVNAWFMWSYLNTVGWSDKSIYFAMKWVYICAYKHLENSEWLSKGQMIFKNGC